MPSTSTEDYIKVVHSLEAEHQRASTQRIAARLGITMASVTGMVKHLAADGYLTHTPYRGVNLTARGRAEALKILRRHRLIEAFLAQTLGLTWDELHADAEALEHVVSDRLIERIDEYLGRPEFDPHGSPIPAKGQRTPPAHGIPLDEIDPGGRYRVVEVADRDPAFLRYLTDLHIRLGSTLTVQPEPAAPGHLTVRAARRSAVLSQEAAHHIRVLPADRPART